MNFTQAPIQNDELSTEAPMPMNTCFCERFPCHSSYLLLSHVYYPHGYRAFLFQKAVGYNYLFTTIIKTAYSVVFKVGS